MSPGPWEYRDNCVFSEGRCIARLDWEIRDDVDDAYGTLIAAAPTLLVALEEARDTLVKLRDDLASVNAELHAQRIAVIELSIEQADPAINAATGGQQ